MEFDDLSNRVIGCGIEVHRELGPGLLESTYEQCLAHELNLKGISFQLQHSQPVQYKGIRLDCGYRIDMLIEHADRRRIDHRTEGCRRDQRHSRGATTNLHETGRHQDGPANQLQRDQTERRHQTICSLTPSCSSCPSWCSLSSSCPSWFFPAADKSHGPTPWRPDESVMDRVPPTRRNNSLHGRRACVRIFNGQSTVPPPGMLAFRSASQ